jgi:hypothetical protein
MQQRAQMGRGEFRSAGEAEAQRCLRRCGQGKRQAVAC